MEIILGKYAGFCHGVSRALAAVAAEMENKKLATYGAIINNSAVTDELAAKGVRIIDDFAGVTDETVIIRSHGVRPEIYKELEAKQIPYIDCTCEVVKKIHTIAKKSVSDGRRLIVIGDERHPEVVGIKGCAGDDCVLINDIESVKTIPENQPFSVVVQTTFSLEKFNKIANELQNRLSDVIVYNTICKSMISRQEEARELSANVDVMLVLGDEKSSNTSKLFEICVSNCEQTYLIPKISDLFLQNLRFKLNIFHSDVKIGIVAGASTPPEIIKEAYVTMSELESNTTDQTFQEMLDESLFTLRTGDIVKGTVISVSNGEVSVNLGYKSDGLIPRSEYSEDPNEDPAAILKPGDSIEVFVVRVNDGDGNVLLSKKKIDSKRSYDEVEAAFNDKTPVVGKVVEVVKGGLVLSVKGVRVFVPNSLVSNRYVADLSQYKGKEMRIEILEFDKSKRRIVGDRKKIAIKEVEENQEKVFGTISEGQDVEGTVSRVTNFGAFIDLGGVDGLIHISELSWGRVKKVSDVLEVGDLVTARVLSVDKEKGRISLSLKDVKENPWNSVASKYEVGQIVEGKVMRMTTFGAFVELEEGVDGLIHISQIAHKHVVKPEDELSVGDIIQVKIMEINTENNRISLSKKEADGVLADDSGAEQAVDAEQAEIEQPAAEAVEEPVSETAAEPVKEAEEELAIEEPANETVE